MIPIFHIFPVGFYFLSLMIILTDVFTILKGLGVFSSPDMPVRFSFLHGSLIFLV